MQSTTIVVARFKESCEWLVPISTYCKIYNKGEMETFVNGYHFKEIENLPNVGRESHTYLHFILSHYDRLPEVVMFTQGCIKDHFGSNNIFILKQMMEDAWRFGKSRATVEYVPSGEHVGSFDADFNFDALSQKWFHEDRYFQDRRLLFFEWLREYIGCDYTVPFYVYRNGIFAVRRNVILKRSKEFYLRLLEQCAHHNDPVEGHFLERSWHYIFS